MSIAFVLFTSVSIVPLMVLSFPRLLLERSSPSYRLLKLCIKYSEVQRHAGCALASYSVGVHAGKRAGRAWSGVTAALCSLSCGLGVSIPNLMTGSLSEGDSSGCHKEIVLRSLLPAWSK